MHIACNRWAIIGNVNLLRDSAEPFTGRSCDEKNVGKSKTNSIRTHTCRSVCSLRFWYGNRCKSQLLTSRTGLFTSARHDKHYRACKSRGLVFILKTSGALRLSLRYFNVEIPIQKVKFVFEDAVDEQFAELSKDFAWCCETKELWTELYSWANADVKHVYTGMFPGGTQL